MNNWEYKTATVETPDNASGFALFPIADAKLAELGAQGWELVTVIWLTSSVESREGASEGTKALQYIFKRPN